MTEQLGLPVWGSYVIFGLATLFSGLALGLVSGNSSLLECKSLPVTSSLLREGRKADVGFLFPTSLCFSGEKSPF